MKHLRYNKLNRSMKKLLGILSVPLIVAGLVKSVPAQSVEPELVEVTTEEPVAEEPVAEEPVVEEPVVEEPKEKRWVCKNCNKNEQTVLDFLQDRGIKDKVSLAVIMGNIQQESRFNTNICEGGARVPYHHCHRGGFGLIQWTTHGRYNGLGLFAKRYGGDPTDLKTQLRWMVNEREWISVEHIFKTPGLSQSQYMNAAYRWLGWGIHGHRTHYSNQYMNRLTQV